MDSARWLTIKAGPAARAALAEGALTPDRIGAVAAAAGGPKWLAIAAFHRTLFADWLSDAHHLPIVGSSIGAWAGAMACDEADPAGAIDALAQRYIAQSYSDKPDARVITETLADILNTALTDGVRRGILSNPRFDLHVLTCRSKGLAASDLHFDPVRVRLHSGQNGFWSSSRGKSGGNVVTAIVFCHRRPITEVQLRQRQERLLLNGRGVCHGTHYDKDLVMREVRFIEPPNEAALLFTINGG